MGSVNLFVGSGHLTRDPVLKTMGTGVVVCRFGVVLNDIRPAPKTTFIEIVCFSAQAEGVAKHLKRGSFVEVVGRLSATSDEGRAFRYEIHADSVNFGPKSWTEGH